MSNDETTILEATFLNRVVDEMRAARVKFPTNKHMLAALTEEAGEVANALLERDYHKGTDISVWKECVQTAAMALRVAVEGDPSFEYQPPKHEELR